MKNEVIFSCVPESVTVAVNVKLTFFTKVARFLLILNLALVQFIHLIFVRSFLFLAGVG